MQVTEMIAHFDTVPFHDLRLWRSFKKNVFEPEIAKKYWTGLGIKATGKRIIALDDLANRLMRLQEKTNGMPVDAYLAELDRIRAELEGL
jgi:hypothetical protein